MLHVDCTYRYADDFSLEVCFETGTGAAALFGPSGSGKSTLISLIAGVLIPDSGTIRLDDKLLFGPNTRLAPDKRELGVVFQDHRLFPHLNVKQNLEFGRRQSSSRGIDFERLVGILELGPLLGRSSETLSGGQRQRVALGRALLRGPRLLLMDEPLTALDAHIKERIMVYLERVLDEWRIPTLFVSHDQAEVRRLAEHVILLREGRVTGAGPTAETLDAALRASQREMPINLLRVAGLRRAEQHWEGRLGAQPFFLVGDPGQTADSVFVRFSARDVILGRHRVPEISVRNQLAGTVREMLAWPDSVLVAVDIGQFLWAQVTPEAARELELAPGKAVTCLIKASAIQVVP